MEWYGQRHFMLLNLEINIKSLEVWDDVNLHNYAVLQDIYFTIITELFYS